MKTSPIEEPTDSAPDLVAKALDKELNGAAGASSTPVQVNDLTSIVKKKKKAPDATANGNGSTKRKADDDPVGSPGDKKMKLES